jgi:hypothetical protein
MKKLILVCLTLLLYNSLVSAQINEDSGMSKYNLYLELGTVLVISSASVNLEAHLYSSTSGKVQWYARAGFGGSAVFYGPVGLGGLGAVTMLTGRDKHHFEVSGGVFLGSDNGFGMVDGFFALPLLDLGYRFQKPGNSFLFRAKAGILGVGIGLGYAF